MLCRRRAGRRDRHGASLGWERRSSEAHQPQPCAHPSDTSRENGEHAAAVSSPCTPLGDSCNRKLRMPKIFATWHMCTRDRALYLANDSQTKPISKKDQNGTVCVPCESERVSEATLALSPGPGSSRTCHRVFSRVGRVPCTGRLALLRQVVALRAACAVWLSCCTVTIGLKRHHPARGRVSAAG